MRAWRWAVVSAMLTCSAVLPTASGASMPTPLTVPEPIHAVDAGLSAVSCPSDARCVAVGSYQIEVRRQGRARRRLGVIEAWNGTRWSVSAGVPFPSLAQRPLALTDVSCASVDACMVLGTRADYTTNPPGSSQPVGERWDGTRWRLTRLAVSHSAAVSLSTVSCSTADDCTAVGSLGYGDRSHALIERWNGRRWTVAYTSPARSGASALSDVACVVPSSCLAIGQQRASRDGATPLVLAEHGGRWHAIAFAISGRPNLAGVSCPTADDCLITGTNYGPTFTPIAERFDGQHLSAIPVTGGAQRVPNSLGEVSCASSTRCLISGAIGAGEDVHGVTRGLDVSDLYDGTAFAEAFTGAFGSASCRPTFCMMVSSADHRMTAHRYQLPLP